MAYLRNFWYVAAWSADVGRELMARTILDEPVLFYRKEDGSPVAVHDRCPHRFAPLHMGKLVGDSVQCGYHGLVFDATGICVSNPHGDGWIPPKACIKRYRAMDRHRLLWIWMGDPARADPEQIPDLSYLEAPDHKTLGGTLNQAANYQLVIDNLMDLSHGAFVHASHHQVDGFLETDHKVVQIGSSIVSKRAIAQTKAPSGFRRLLKYPDANVAYWLTMRWDAPSVCQLETGVSAIEDGVSRTFRSRGTHIVTPETEFTSHYFYASTRGHLQDDAAFDLQVREWQATGFGEQDKPMLAAVQKRMGTADLDSLSPVILLSDAAAMRVRRTIRELLKAEAHPPK